MVDTRRVLFVDLTLGDWHADQVEVEGMFGLGGKILGVFLLERHLDTGVDPLAPENLVAITSSPLAPYSVAGSDRFGAFTKSPLTGIWLETYCGGSFARTFSETGWDAVVISGAAAAPVHLHIDAEGAQLLSAAALWGQDTFAVEAAILSKLRRRSAALSIGAAGENLVRVASVMHEHAHALGRGGLGAVFGSKKLKAVSVTSPGRAKPEAGDRFAQTRRDISRQAVESPAGENYRRFGTPAMVGLTNEAGIFPTDFFAKGAAPHRASLEAEGWPEWATIEHEGCPPCPMRCRKHLTLNGGPEAGRKLHGPEYEAIYTFGGSCMVEQAEEVARLNELCNRLGIDTISGGNLAAVAIKARQSGAIDDGPLPGDVGGIAALVDAIANRSTATGAILALGMDDALAAWDMSGWSITSKRLDPAGYEPRKLKGMALSNAVGVRGACHLRATFYKAELAGLLDGLDDDAYVQTYVDWEDRMLLMDCLTMCRFYRDFLSWDDMLTLTGELNGGPVTKQELQQLCAEATTRIRRLNLAFGLTAAADTVAERFFLEPTDKAPALDRAELERRVRLYWVKRGWTEEGLPPG